MKIKIGFIDFKENKDDIYPLPTLAIGHVKSHHGKAIGFGIKFLKIIWSVGFIFPKDK